MGYSGFSVLPSTGLVAEAQPTKIAHLLTLQNERGPGQAGLKGKQHISLKKLYLYVLVLNMTKDR